MLNLGLINDIIRDQRMAAMAEARQSFRCIKSRGTFVATASKGDQCDPYPEAEACQWNFTKKELQAVIDRVQRDYPNVDEVYIAGGYDGAETMGDLINQGDYEPWVSSWKVTIWTRGS